MNRSILLLGLLLFAAFVAGRWTQAGEEAPTAAADVVHALRYRIVWVESALELSHGGGRWVHELFFPGAKVTATLVFDTPPRIYVGRADKPRTDLTGLSKAPPFPAEDVEVPRKLAKAVAAFAELDARYRAEAARLGQDLASTLGLKQIPPQAEEAKPSR